MNGDQLLDEPHQPVGVTLARHRGDDVPLGVHHRERRPCLRGVLLPGDQVGVVQHRMRDAVPLDRRGQRGAVALVLELW
jgi:hypothetical protein